MESAWVQTELGWHPPLGTFLSKAAFSQCWRSYAHCSNLLAIQKLSSVFLMIEALHWFCKTSYFLFPYLRAYLWGRRKEHPHKEQEHSFQLNSQQIPSPPENNLLFNITGLLPQTTLRQQQVKSYITLIFFLYLWLVFKFNMSISVGVFKWRLTQKKGKILA